MTSSSTLDASLRDLLAARLGIDACELRGPMSLQDDLAVDSLELVDLAVAIEAELGVEIPRRSIERVRTVDELIHEVSSLAGGASGDPPPVLWRAFELDPQALEIVVAETRRAGPQGRLEVVLPREASGRAADRRIEGCATVPV